MYFTEGPEVYIKLLFPFCFLFQNIIKFARLYNITDDPAERKDLSEKLPHVVIKLLARVWHYNHSPNFIPALKKNKDRNARRVARENGYWGPWRG